MSQFTAEVQLFPVWKTNVRHVGFFFRLLLRPYHSNWRAVPHQATTFRPNRATRGGVMTSYTISRWRHACRLFRDYCFMLLLTIMFFIWTNAWWLWWWWWWLVWQNLGHFVMSDEAAEISARHTEMPNDVRELWVIPLSALTSSDTDLSYACRLSFKVFRPFLIYSVD